MEYTRKEYEEILKPNGKAIEEFIRTEIQPYLMTDIEIPFGNIVHRGRCEEIKEQEFTLFVRNDKVFGRIGGLVVYFDMPDYLKGSCGSIDIYNDYGWGGNFLYNLCLNWQTIKAKLNKAVESQKNRRNTALNEFVL